MPRSQAQRVVTLLERLTPEVVWGWIPTALEEAARDDARGGRVSRPAIRTTTIQAVVADEKRGQVRVRIEWTAGRPVSACECGARGKPCRHAAALAMLLVGGATPEATDDAGADEDGADALADGPESAADVERRRRRERGATDLFTVKPRPSTRIHGVYDVGSPSSRAYEVTLRALDAHHNSCTCPDFDTNLLGTCKHIEAVLHYLQCDARRRLARAVASGPPDSYLYLSFDPEPQIRLRAVGSDVALLSSRFFARDGRALFTTAEDWPQAQAHGLVRAGELARAFATTPLAPPESLVAEVAAEARGLLARARERLAVRG